MSSPSPFAEVTNFAFEITAEATNSLAARLRADGVENPNVVACLALAAVATRLSTADAKNLAESDAARASVEAFAPAESPEQLARREAEAEGKLVVMRFEGR